MSERKRHFFRRGELHLVLLAMLRSHAQHGYDLMSELGALCAPRYTPSPGSVYPALAALDDEGLIEVVSDGSRRVYALTEPGRRALADRERLLAGFEARTGVAVSPDGRLDAALTSFARRVRAASPAADVVGPILDDAATQIERIGRTT